MESNDSPFLLQPQSLSAITGWWKIRQSFQTLSPNLNILMKKMFSLLENLRCNVDVTALLYLVNSLALSDLFSLKQLVSSPTHTPYTGSTSIIDLVFVSSHVHASFLVFTTCIFLRSQQYLDGLLPLPFKIVY